MRPVFRSVLALAAVVVPSALAAQKQVVTVPNARPTPILSSGIKVGDLLFMSGQLPDRADTTIQTQTTSALKKMEPILAAAGSSVDKIVKCTVYLIDGKDFQGMNESYRAFFTKEPPARTTVVVAALVSPGAKLEIECVASLK
jgi:reactive intermediate/imine deaminase